MLLNQRFAPTVCAGEKGLDIIEAVFKAHFAKGGFHIQINVLDDKTLRAAQKDPDSYRNILVRVAGYSAYFVDLSEEIPACGEKPTDSLNNFHSIHPLKKRDNIKNKRHQAKNCHNGKYGNHTKRNHIKDRRKPA